MMPNMMMGCSHGGIPFVGALVEKSGPDVELEKIIEIHTNLDSVIWWFNQQLFCKRGISINPF